MKQILAEPFARLWQDRDAFAAVRALEGQVFRELEGRRTLRTEVAGRGYFVKLHQGIGWSEIAKNLLQLRLPVLGAGREWRALQQLHAAGVPTMQAVAFGERGLNPARQQSFIITEELAPALSLEELALGQGAAAPGPAFRRVLVAAVAQLVRVMHQAGVNHRDCYLCHILLLEPDAPESRRTPRLALIDLHRAQIHHHLPRRWRDKDLAGLYFSALEVGLSRRDALRFLRGYFCQPLRQLLGENARLLRWLERRARQLLERKQRYGGQL
mgnify:CR=1 FL=1